MEKVHNILKIIYNLISGFWSAVGIKLFIYCTTSSDEEENLFSIIVLTAILVFIVPMNIDFYRTSENKKYIPLLFFLLGSFIYIALEIGEKINV